jgi:hypothetical protein
MTKTATFVRNLTGYTGDAKLYNTTDQGYLIVSAVVVPYTGPETYIFPADEDGEITDWLELDGSFRGGLDHEAALVGAGYTLA